MRTAALYLCLMVCTFCLVVPSGCGKKDADVAGTDSTKTDKKKDRAAAKKDAKNTAATKKGDAVKEGAKKKTDETVASVDVPERTRDQILGYYTDKVKFSDEQMDEADEIIKSHGAEFRELRERSAKFLTKEMRDARAEATKKALEGGASKADAAKAGRATIDPATSAKLDEIDEEENALVKKVRLEVRKVLTKEQKEVLKEAAKSNRNDKDAEKADGE